MHTTGTGPSSPLFTKLGRAWRTIGRGTQTLDDNIGRRISVARSIGNSIFGKTNKVLALHGKPVHGHTFARCKEGLSGDQFEN
jgi:hypothetical protein